MKFRTALLLAVAACLSAAIVVQTVTYLDDCIARAKQSKELRQSVQRVATAACPTCPPVEPPAVSDVEPVCSWP